MVATTQTWNWLTWQYSRATTTIILRRRWWSNNLFEYNETTWRTTCRATLVLARIFMVQTGCRNLLFRSSKHHLCIFLLALVLHGNSQPWWLEWLLFGLLQQISCLFQFCESIPSLDRNHCQKTCYERSIQNVMLTCKKNRVSKNIWPFWWCENGRHRQECQLRCRGIHTSS